MSGRIIIVGWELPPIFIHGGLGVYELNLSKEYRARGYDVTLVGALPIGFDYLVGKRHSVEGFEIYPVATVVDLGVRDVAMLRVGVSKAVDELLREYGDDVRAVIVNDLHVVTAVESAVAHEVPVAYLAHTISGDMVEGGFAYRLGMVVTNSKIMAASLRDLYESMRPNIYPSVDPPRVVFTYPGVPEVRNAHDDVAGYYRSMGGGGCDYVIGVLGRWNQPNKRLQWLIDIVKGLREVHGLRVCGLIGGVGVPEGVSDYVRLCGFVHEDEKGSFLQALDVFVLTSEFEPFGMVAAEAVSVGVPAVVPDASGVAEVLGVDEEIRKHTVYRAKDLSDVVDKIAKLLINKDLYVRTVTKEKMLVEELMSWSYVADFLLMVADETIAGLR